MSVTLLLEDDLDLGRGDMICRPEDAPEPVRELTADVCWMTDEPLRAGARYAIKHTTRTARAVVDGVEHRVDVHTLEPERADELGAERHRPRAPAPERAARGRSLRPQPHHRQLHPHRRGHQRHGGRGHDRGLGRLPGRPRSAAARPTC